MSHLPGGSDWLSADALRAESGLGSTPRDGIDRWDAMLLGLAVAIAVGYLIMGVGPVLDDWFALRNAHFDGVLRAAGSDQIAARPAGSLIYALVFGVFGRSVVPTVLLLALANAFSAAILRRIVGWIAPGGLAVICAGLWIVLPTTTTIEVWASASNISVGLALALGGLYLSRRGVDRRDRRVSALVACATAG